MEVLILVTLINVILCMVVSTVGILAWVELKSFMKSTHKVEYVPFEPEVPLKKEIMRDQDLNEYDI